MAKRYEQMVPMIRKLKPSRIVEVGVHRAMRASLMCRTALEYGPVSYLGYDVFETMGEAFQKEALNGKGEPTQAAARRRLEDIKGDFTYSFVIGDTRDTLHGDKVQADFAFIDGDHRVDAIRGDYKALDQVKCVVFDDYYVADQFGGIPDLTKYGANSIVEEAKQSGKRAEVLPMADGCNVGGKSHLAVVWRD